MKITQREASRLRRRVNELESQLAMLMTSWNQEMPSYTAIGRETSSATLHRAIRVARQLKHAVVAVEQSNTEIVYFACDITTIK